MVEPGKQVCALEALLAGGLATRGIEVGRDGERVELAVAVVGRAVELFGEVGVELEREGGERGGGGSASAGLSSARRTECVAQIGRGAEERETDPCQSRARRPPALPLAPAATALPSTRVMSTGMPLCLARRARKKAVDEPMMPPPTTATERGAVMASGGGSTGWLEEGGGCTCAGDTVAVVLLGRCSAGACAVE